MQPKYVKPKDNTKTVRIQDTRGVDVKFELQDGYILYVHSVNTTRNVKAGQRKLNDALAKHGHYQDNQYHTYLNAKAEQLGFADLVGKHAYSCSVLAIEQLHQLCKGSPQGDLLVLVADDTPQNWYGDNLSSTEILRFKYKIDAKHQPIEVEGGE